MESVHAELFNSSAMQAALAQAGLTRDSQLQAALADDDQPPPKVRRTSSCSSTMSSGDGDDQHGKSFYFLLCYFSFWFM